MPCTKCENGKYKWGETGECKYDSKEECEKANPKKYSKMKPTPLGKKSYEEYEKELKEFNLSKVERVELALLDDIKSTGEKLDKMFNAAIKVAVDGATKLAKKIDEEAKTFNKQRNTLSAEIDNFKKQAKAIGVNPNDIPNLKKFEKELKATEGRSKELKRISTNIRNAY